MVIFVQITVFGKLQFERCAGNDFKKGVADCFVRYIISNVHKFVTQVVFMGVSDVMLAKQGTHLHRYMYCGKSVWNNASPNWLIAKNTVGMCVL